MWANKWLTFLSWEIYRRRRWYQPRVKHCHGPQQCTLANATLTFKNDYITAFWYCKVCIHSTNTVGKQSINLGLKEGWWITGYFLFRLSLSACPASRSIWLSLIVLCPKLDRVLERNEKADDTTWDTLNESLSTIQSSLNDPLLSNAFQITSSVVILVEIQLAPKIRHIMMIWYRAALWGLRKS